MPAWPDRVSVNGRLLWARSESFGAHGLQPREQARASPQGGAFCLPAHGRVHTHVVVRAFGPVLALVAALQDDLKWVVQKSGVAPVKVSTSCRRRGVGDASAAIQWRIGRPAVTPDDQGFSTSLVLFGEGTRHTPQGYTMSTGSVRRLSREDLAMLGYAPVCDDCYELGFRTPRVARSTRCDAHRKQYRQWYQRTQKWESRNGRKSTEKYVARFPDGPQGVYVDAELGLELRRIETSLNYALQALVAHVHQRPREVKDKVWTDTQVSVGRAAAVLGALAERYGAPRGR